MINMIISPAIVIDNRLVITEDLVIILPVVSAWLLLYVILYCTLAWQAWANSVDPDENVVSHQGIHCLPLIQLFLETALGSKLYLFVW